MKCRDLVKYLSGFDPDENVATLIMDLETRQAYEISGCQLITDAGQPVVLFELGEASPLDETVEEAPDGD